MRNAALDDLERLIGDWDLTLTNAWFLDSMDREESGWASFEWLDDTLVVFRWTVGDTPPTVCVIGYNTPRAQYEMLYHDDRGVARHFVMEFADNRWTLLREDPDFYQRFDATLEDDRILAAWYASEEDEGETWRKDFDLIFERVTSESTG